MFLIIATVMMAEYNTGLQRNTERRTSKGYIYKTKPIRDFKRSYANVLKDEIAAYTDNNESFSTPVDFRLTDTFSIPTESVLSNLGFDHFSLLFYNPYIKDKAYQKDYKELRLKNLKYLSKYYRENFNLKIAKNDNGTYNPTELDLVSVFDNLYHPSYKTYICENYAGSEYHLVIRCRNNQKCFLLMHQTAAVGSNFFWKNNVAIGKNTKIGVRVYLEEDVLIGNDCIIQDNVHIGFGTSILDGFRCTSNVIIGNRNIILKDVHINCNVEYELRLNQLYGIITGNKDRQVIGDGNTIEKNVSISTSKQIENGCIIEEGANVSLQEDRLFFTKVSNNSDCNYFLPDLSDSEELPVPSC